MLKKFIKDPNAVLDYRINWSTWLYGDNISNSIWTADEGLIVHSIKSSFTDTTTTVWVSGGTVGNTYTVTNRITTVSGRRNDRSIRIRIKEL